MNEINDTTSQSDIQPSLPEITPAMLKAAGLNSWRQEFMGDIGSKFTSRGYTFDQWRETVRKYCYFSNDYDGGLYVRLRPTFDPEAKPCPQHNNSEIVMQPWVDASWRCPKCGYVAERERAAAASNGDGEARDE